MHKMIYDDLNTAFSKKYGWSPRKEGIFCTGDSSQASMYGHPHIIFPTGRYKYIWSDEYQDLYISLSHIVPGVGSISRHTAPENENPLIAKIAQEKMSETIISRTIRDKYDKEHGEGSAGNWKFTEKPHWKTHTIPSKYNKNPGDWLKKNGFVEGPGGNVDGHLYWVPSSEYGEFYEKERAKLVDQLKKDSWEQATAKYEIILDGVVNTYTDKGLISAIKSKGEIMLNTQYYYQFPRYDVLGFFEAWFRNFGDRMPSDEEAMAWYAKTPNTTKWPYGEFGFMI